MANDMSRKQERKGTSRIVGWGAALALVLSLCLLAFFLFAPFTNGSRQMLDVKRTPEQNVGQGNAPADSRPSPGVQKDSSGNAKLPTQQGGG
ncbi:hypothetical protein P9273_21500 [Mesorhizobium sp. WSM4935]|uniref:hypothetical protein n=1 Tax=Mesorhizobium sp. WSM4935 TaxID=3038547 RepID=UPI0024154D23|nr:hypothetical protein [Mesorhizobium sp. WSM4935]MDG4877682.1 hypothetical protein [Mesorhizobium sp. WSM4935]